MKIIYKKSTITFFPLLLFSLLILFLPRYLAGFKLGYINGKVIDSFTYKPIKGALVTMNDTVVITDENGMFSMKTVSDKVAVRAYGYMRTEQPIGKPSLFTPFVTSPIVVKLVPFTPKGLYLSFYGIGSKILRTSALDLIKKTELNTLVIDVKGDRGMIMYKSSIPLASEIGAQRIITVKDITSLMSSLKEQGIYTIARIVVFKDNLLAHARPDLAIRTHNNGIWYDRENLAWTDPFKKEVWDYDINIAVEAAQIGFDEIQFDYVRFPDTNGLNFSMPNTEENRVKAITGFLTEARNRLIPYNVFLSADIFGYVLWNQNDTKIGQRLEDIAPILDYINPMLYPSGFQHGIPHYRLPVAYPSEIVYLTLRRAQQRTHLSTIRFRPWLQAFRDYAFDKRNFTGEEIRAQIDAAEKFGSHGWMLWNPRNTYSSDGLKKDYKIGY
jgi:hypothetical protein